MFFLKKKLTSLSTQSIYNFSSLSIIKFVAFHKSKPVGYQLHPVPKCHLIFSIISILQQKSRNFCQNMSSRCWVPFYLGNQALFCKIYQQQRFLYLVKYLINLIVILIVKSMHRHKLVYFFGKLASLGTATHSFYLILDVLFYHYMINILGHFDKFLTN